MIINKKFENNKMRIKVFELYTILISFINITIWKQYFKTKTNKSSFNLNKIQLIFICKKFITLQITIFSIM